MSSPDGRSHGGILTQTKDSASQLRQSSHPFSPTHEVSRQRQNLDVNEECLRIPEKDVMRSCIDWKERYGNSQYQSKTANSKSRRKRTVEVTPNSWKGNVVYYGFDSFVFSPSEKQVIESAMKELQNLTCLQFQEVDKDNESANKILFVD